MLSLQIPLSFDVSGHRVRAGSSLLRPHLLRVQVLGQGLGLLVGGQLLAVEPVQIARRAFGEQAVTLVLLALGLLASRHVDVLSLLLSQALQRGAGTPDASAAAAASAKGLLLDGQQRTGVCQVPKAELLLDEAVQHCSGGVLGSSHFSYGGKREMYDYGLSSHMYGSVTNLRHQTIILVKQPLVPAVKDFIQDLSRLIQLRKLRLCYDND